MVKGALLEKLLGADRGRGTLVFDGVCTGCFGWTGDGGLRRTVCDRAGQRPILLFDQVVLLFIEMVQRCGLAMLIPLFTITCMIHVIVERLLLQYFLDGIAFLHVLKIGRPSVGTWIVGTIYIAVCGLRTIDYEEWLIHMSCCPWELLCSRQASRDICSWFDNTSYIPLCQRTSAHMHHKSTIGSVWQRQRLR